MGAPARWAVTVFPRVSNSALPPIPFDTLVTGMPGEPIGGYVYAGGTGEGTVWQLHAETVYV